jgi:hypothetical protein
MRKFQMDMQHNRLVALEEGIREGKIKGIRGGKILMSLLARIGRELDDELDSALDAMTGDKRVDMLVCIAESKIEVAEKMLASGFSIDLIVRHTGLTREEAENLIEGEIKDRREEKFDAAKKMLSEGISPNLIVRFTGLVLRQIESLRTGD